MLVCLSHKRCAMATFEAVQAALQGGTGSPQQVRQASQASMMRTREQQDLDVVCSQSIGLRFGAYSHVNHSEVVGLQAAQPQAARNSPAHFPARSTNVTEARLPSAAAPTAENLV